MSVRALLFSGRSTPWFIAAGATGTTTAVVPTGYAANDLLVLVGTGDGTGVGDPAGWSIALASGGISPKMGVWYKISSASESSVVLGGVSAVMLAYRSINGTPLDVLGTNTTDTNTTISTTTLTTTVVNDLVLSIYAGEISTGTGAWTAPASTNERVNQTGNGMVAGILIVDEIKAAAGATTARTATCANSEKLSVFSVSFKNL